MSTTVTKDQIEERVSEALVSFGAEREANRELPPAIVDDAREQSVDAHRRKGSGQHGERDQHGHQQPRGRGPRAEAVVDCFDVAQGDGR